MTSVVKNCPEHGPILQDQCYLVGSSTRCKQCELQRARARNISNRYKVLQHYSGPEPFCAFCGESNPSFLGLDHVNNGGKKHQVLAKFSSATSWARSNGYPPIFQVLCHNCNILKTWISGSSLSAARNFAVKTEVFTHYSSGTPKCLWCDTHDIRLLTLDHIDGGGNAHRRSISEKLKSGGPFYRYLKRASFPTGLRVLCFNHNLGLICSGKPR